MEKLTYSRKEVCQLLGMSQSTVIRREQEGILRPCKGGPGIRYPKSQVDKMAGITEEEFNATPFENRRLKIENRRLKEENRKLRSRMQQISVLTNDFMREEIEREVDQA